MNKLKKMRKKLCLAIVNTQKQHKIIEHAIKKEVKQAVHKAKKISREKALAAFSGQLLIDNGLVQPAPFYTHVDIPDVGFHRFNKEFQKK